jgi:hypothetical protein
MRWALVSILVAMLVVAWPAHTLADQDGVVHSIGWAHEKEAGRLLAGEVLEDEGVLRLTNDTRQPRRVIVLELDSPAVETAQWHLEGQVRYRDLRDEGYLEMLSVLPSGSFATRTAAKSGPRGKLTGTSDWRPVWMPFDASMKDERPNKLVLAIQLPGHATVDLGPFERVATWLFGLGAMTLLGLAMALSLLVRRRKHRRFVLGTYRAVLGTAVLVLVVGSVAVISGQPTTVYFPLLIVGLLASAIFGVSYRAAKSDFNQHAAST